MGRAPDNHVSAAFRAVLLTLALTVSSACAHVRVHPTYGDHALSEEDPDDTLARSRIEDPGLRAGLFVVNWVPNLVSNYVAGLWPGDLWPIQYLLLPVSGAYWGTRDAWHGYPFWEPTAVWD